ncbi:GNAT family N-acetyltransferase, partial [Acinetobacter baumannii]
LNGLDTAADCLHLHDVALLPAARGSGLGRELVDDLCRVAEQAGLPMATLVAVHASSAYWRAAGFVEDAQALAGKGGSLGSYGEGALYMS